MSTLEQKYGRYEVVRLIGQGGMGRVYEARDPVLDRAVALKVISLDPALDSGVRDEFLERFVLEARAGARLNHPSIVAVYDAGTQNDTPWMAFEFVDGDSLEHLLAATPRIEQAMARGIAASIAAALAVAHAHGIIHRDIKPANILIDKKNGLAKLADFGIARVPWTGLTREGNTVGTPGYMAPEQIEGGETDASTDLFSLGVLLYQMLTGKNPFLRDTAQATLFATLGGAYTDIATQTAGIDSSLCKAVRAALQVDRSRRIGCAKTFEELLGASGETRSGDPSAKEGAHILFRAAGRALGTLATQGPQAALQAAERVRKLAGDKKQTYRYMRATALGLGEIAGATRRGWAATSNRVAQMLNGRIRVLDAKTRTSLTIATAAVVIISIGWAGVVWVQGHRARRSAQRIEELLSQDAVPSGVRAARWNLAEDEQSLVDRCFELLANEQYGEALGVAVELVSAKPAFAPAHIFAGRAAWLTGDYSMAASSFARAKQLKGGREELRRFKTTLLTDLRQILSQSDASQSLVRAAVTILSGSDFPIVAQWLQSREYWVRWNSVTLLEAGKRKVDLVPLYILDLQSAGSASTRVRAARKLGEMGDRRAVAVLREASGRGLRDPFTAAAASVALEKLKKE